MANIIDKILAISPLKRELIRLLICCGISVLLSIFLFAGVGDDGEIKEWAVKPITLLTSTTLIKLTPYMLAFLAYTILKAWILDANEKFQGVLSFIANQITGLFYCAGMVSASLSFQLYLIKNQEYKSILPIIPTFLIIGAFYFYILQCFIQKSIQPKLWESAVDDI